MTTPDRIEIEIELGSDAMQEPRQAADELRKIADKLEAGQTDGPIMDLNGNSVGFYRTVC
jgi:hypothetical protein